MKPYQFKLFNNSIQREFGGSLLRCRRKTRRPLSTRVPIHLVLRSENKRAYKALAYGSSTNRKILSAVAKRFQIQILDVIFNHSHVHLVIRIPSRESYNAFIRLLTSRLAQFAKLKKGELFQFRPYTRLLSWGREIKTVLNYMKKNYVEAIGSIEIRHAEIPLTFETNYPRGPIHCVNS